MNKYNPNSIIIKCKPTESQYPKPYGSVDFAKIDKFLNTAFPYVPKSQINLIFSNLTTIKCPKSNITLTPVIATIVGITKRKIVKPES